MRKTKEYELTSSACNCNLVFSLVSRFTFSSSHCRSSMACCWGGKTRFLRLGCTCVPQSHILHSTASYPSVCHIGRGKAGVVWLQSKCQKSSPVWSDVSETFSLFNPSTGNKSVGTSNSVTAPKLTVTAQSIHFVFFMSFCLYFRLKSLISQTFNKCYCLSKHLAEVCVQGLLYCSCHSIWRGYKGLKFL